MRKRKMILCKCKHCDNKELRQDIEKYRKEGCVCKDCRSSIRSKTMKKTQDGRTKEQKREATRLANVNRTNRGEIVKKQWETIKSLPKEEYEEFCRKRSERMKNVWREKYTQEQKNDILTKLVQSNNKARSIGSDKLKKMMVDKGIVDFVSEECFHGFFPDEINHNLKIIIEYYGDIYHCNPKRFKDETEYCTFIQRTVGEQWKRDKIRLACFYKHGYTVIVVWESDFHKNPQKEIERIENEINKKRNFGGKI